jgi:exosortase K
MTLKVKNKSYFIVASVLFIFLKISYKNATAADLHFLLKPVNELVSLMVNSQSVLLSEGAFYHERWNVVIDKSCSGFNFMLIGFMIFTLLFVAYFEKRWQKIVSFVLAFLAAYLLTIFSNSARIFASIIFQNQTNSIFPNDQETIHEGIGTITNLSFLILAFLAVNHFLTKTKNNEKLA